MLEAVTLVGLAAASAALVAFWQSARWRALARARLEEDLPPPPESERGTPPPPVRPFLRSYAWAPWLAGLMLAGGLYGLARLGAIFALTFGAMVILLGARLEAWRVARLRLLSEVQLADAIDLMISTLQAGASVFAALESAVHEARAPLRPQLEEVLRRIRYGGDPQAVMRALERRVPLETFRLFSAALAVHWEVGGSLAPVLATVGRTIRDRIELSRRIRSLTTQARASTVAILLTTYFIAFVVWRNDPARMGAFLSTTIGQGLVATAVLLQAVGIAWSSALSRMKY